MRTQVSRALAGLVLLLAVAGSPLDLAGQVTGLPDPPPPSYQVRLAPRVLSPAGGGWLGFRVRFEVTETAARSPAGFRAALDRTHHIQVEEVLPEGPARAAGMAPGDRILLIDGMDAGGAIEAGVLSMIRPGQTVRVGIERDGRALEVRIVAATRPVTASPASPAALARVRTDSIVSHMLLHIDSARASVAREAVTLSVSVPGSPVERRPLAVMRPGFPVDSVSYLGVEAGVARSSATTLRALVSGRDPDAASRTGGAPPGPILIYATGQRAVLGAEITPVNPGLASYFGVDAGLLVTQVVEGAPGARGGLTPGDVIVRVGSVPVSTVEAFRVAAEAGFRSPPLVIGVVREGRRLELRIPR